jgi:hypothetical protein
MKIQKQVAYKYKDKIHHKFVVIIPQEIISDLGWVEGQEVKPKINGVNLTLEPVS